MHKHVILICLLISFTAALLVSCGPNTNYIRRMQALEEGVDNPTTVQELEEAISKYQKRVEDVLNADIRTGMWYKILAIRYLDNAMYEKALENFRIAIEFYPTNQNLYYYVGVCAGYLAKASLDFEATGSRAEQSRYYALAESAYLRAIELEPRYVRALYGVSVLYVFELEKPDEAIRHLSVVLEIEKKNVDAMFILARAYFMTGNAEDAVSLYDAILGITKDEKKLQSARENKAFVLENAYGNE